MDRITAIRAFVRLVELASFSGVARELRVTQSTVSKWIAALEEELGAQLVERTTRTQRVTDAGERFYERARDILAAYDEATAEVAAGAPALRGRVRASVPVVFGERYVVPYLASFLKAHPELELELVLSDRYLNLVDEGIDVAIRVGLPADSSFRARTIAEARRYVVASPAYLCGKPAVRKPDDLRAHACLLHTELRAGDTWTFTRASRSEPARIRVRGTFAANHSATLLEMAREGLGIALLADWLVRDDLAEKRLVSLLPSYHPPRAPIQAVLPPGRRTHPRVQAFVEHFASAWERATVGDGASRRSR